MYKLPTSIFVAVSVAALIIAGCQSSSGGGRAPSTSNTADQPATILASDDAEAQTGGQYAAAGQVSIQSFYNSGTPADHIVPQARTHPRGTRTSGIVGSQDPIVFDRGEFSGYFFGNQYGSRMRQIIQSGGTDIDSLTSLLGQHRGNEEVALFHDGYMIVYGGNQTIVVPIGRNVTNGIHEL